ncbi:hypothetical protein KQI38_21180 [Tissierella carlieri]|jgi:UDP-glucose 6-dehydrogenase|uniref:Uncharacterized protein n=1 Tax=Tissierella pigra TaxID=2607614 RepID=A0A6N7Y3V6_9FIRM|nr:MULTISPECIES: hypothetical protein [Tissierella]MBU5314540.1 hypothetical protein [Tissierella carlieri]MSU03148.1 hypothetical protein [Tissierella pigra]
MKKLGKRNDDKRFTSYYKAACEECKTQCIAGCTPPNDTPQGMAEVEFIERYYQRTDFPRW